MPTLIVREQRIPRAYHECGWVSTPGGLIPCADPCFGPFSCPRCGGRLEDLPGESPVA